MTYLLRLSACLFVFISIQSSASYVDIKVEASGILTSVDSSRYPSLSIGDSWSSSTIFRNVNHWSSARFNYGSASGSLQLGNYSSSPSRANGVNGPISASTCVGCLNELYFLWGYDNYFFIDGRQITNIQLRMESGLTPASLTAAQLTDMESIINNFDFNLPNPSILQVDGHIEGSVDSFALSQVPLPAGIYLFLSGLVGLGLMRGRNA